ncbi:30S ribosomal protein S16 [Candidatus Rhabdochlamydia porcellionis]|jgi:small subunit ribosomal protein S16|uniref:Small ribosomal subunit protein bS16 n=1 Tax=Candidatus Rhabdochlamydia porcellionis TaxID=225148 RepID=A0ABX8Z4H1_9BACT|nr:30S ribosomal protein S16 [Candidatus Rhabdochlamydia porcellionis]QZA58972.1 Ribosomal protein S16 [Candidatus Rhabdochlamydia porcellionis]
MALKIRFRQQGSANRRTYRLVLADGRERRDGKYIEKFGWYDPKATNDCLLNETRIKYWIDQGAQLTPNAEALVARALPELMKEIRLKKQVRFAKQAKKRRARKKQPVPAA